MAYGSQGKKVTWRLRASALTEAECWGKGLQVTVHITVHSTRGSHEQCFSDPHTFFFGSFSGKHYPQRSDRLKKLSHHLPHGICYPKGSHKRNLPRLDHNPTLCKELHWCFGVIAAISPLLFMSASPIYRLISLWWHHMVKKIYIGLEGIDEIF